MCISLLVLDHPRPKKKNFTQKEKVKKSAWLYIIREKARYRWWKKE